MTKVLVLVPPGAPGLETPAGFTDRWQVIVVEDGVAIGARLHKELRAALLQMYHDGSPYEVMSQSGNVRWRGEKVTVESAKELIAEQAGVFVTAEEIAEIEQRTADFRAEPSEEEQW